MTRLVSCLHNRNRLAGATIALSIVFLIETPEAAESPRARAVPYLRIQHVVARQALSYG